jgi:general secretion pathway protein L
MDGRKLMLVLLLEAEGPDRWWRLDASGRRLAEGEGWANAVPLAGEAVHAVAPAGRVSLHRVTIPPLAPAQAAAAARAMASDLSAAPTEAMHIALGAADGADGADGRWLAMVDADEMAGWLARLEAAGLEPARLVPAPLLLPEGSAFERAGLMLVRQGETAFGAEAALAALMVETLPPLIDAQRLAAGLPERLMQAVNLRQGRFALVQPWRPRAGQARRLAWLAAAAALLLGGAQGVGVWRAGRAADAAEAGLVAAAAAVLPPGTRIESPRAQVAARLRALGGGGLSALAVPLLAALEARPNVAIASLEHSPEAGLTVMLEGASPGDAAAIAEALRAAGLAPSLGLPRVVSGQPQTVLSIKAR